MKLEVTYFEKPGKDNSDEVMAIVKKRAQELDIKTVVVASYRGFTAQKAVAALGDIRIIACMGFLEPNMQNLSESFSQGDENTIKSKATVLIATHIFSGINRAMRKKYDTSSPGEIIAQSLRTISVGVKVAIECSMMAADAALVRTDEDIIAIGGTRSGADTAIVLRPVNSQDFFDLKLKEILCKPREW